MNQAFFNAIEQGDVEFVEEFVEKRFAQMPLTHLTNLEQQVWYSNWCE